MLKQQILEDLKAAMKAGEATKRDTLRMLDSTIKNEEISTGKREEGLDDAGVITLVKRSIKQRTDAAKQYTDAGRPELAETELAEIAVIESYLPEQLTDDALRESLTKVIADAGATDPSDMGKVMGPAMQAVGDGADGARVRTMITEILSAG